MVSSWYSVQCTVDALSRSFFYADSSRRSPAYLPSLIIISGQYWTGVCLTISYNIHFFLFYNKYAHLDMQHSLRCVVKVYTILIKIAIYSDVKNVCLINIKALKNKYALIMSDCRCKQYIA